MISTIRRRAASRCIASLLALLLFIVPTLELSAQRRLVSQAEGARPRLVLLIVVDQFRYDYLDRFGDLFSAGGIKRLLREGASWTNANYDHVPTETAPGHATLMTGTWPANTGIVGNSWFDRDEGKLVTSVSDESVKLLGGGESETASSPHRLLASTLGDELRLATQDRAKVIGISLKDRSAILPAGRHASAAYWFSTQTGNMVSSSYYLTQLPAWVVRFNQSRFADRYFGARWERLLPEAEYEKRAGADAPSWENIGRVKDTNTFPHNITGGAQKPGREFYEALEYSPFANELLEAFAEQAIINEGLGADDDTDLLSVSFSSNDYVGHRFGPYSHEEMDMVLRVDRQIEKLLNFVEAHVGLRRTIVVFTADHGVAPIPEHAATLNLPGGRVKRDAILNAIREAIRARYGREKEYVQHFTNGNVYFDLAALRRDGIARAEIERLAAEAVMTVPGVARCFTRTQLEMHGVSSSDPIARRVYNGFNSRRNGELVIVYEPFKFSSEFPAGTTHGTPYSYDTHVPLIIMGAGVRPGRYAQAATPADIAPTLATLLRVQPPSSATGRALVEALDSDALRARAELR
ncbi:alkaline phosphatase family protein [Pyrinomonas methylaliphatogenes]|uniref:Arylsulfatase A family protein n=1 Tax=Pyrinomonas methylaliphatogenes TaxID=454194 RepID=A0A0B6WZN5_9BACT|nr:alkaline phosphatase family protein [Pyrinomonas methylaliphatogenes]CDM66743.1 arylsulfatase A family protein [Pyrinomonas methylaliphatogenes]